MTISVDSEPAPRIKILVCEPAGPSCGACKPNSPWSKSFTVLCCFLSISFAVNTEREAGIFSAVKVPRDEVTFIVSNSTADTLLENIKNKPRTK